jgi:hypothetical protein
MIDVQFPAGEGVSIFAVTSWSALESTRPLTQWIPRDKADDSPECGTEVKNAYLHSPVRFSWVALNEAYWLHTIDVRWEGLEWDIICSHLRPSYRAPEIRYKQTHAMQIVLYFFYCPRSVGCSAEAKNENRRRLNSSKIPELWENQQRRKCVIKPSSCNVWIEQSRDVGGDQC